MVKKILIIIIILAIFNLFQYNFTNKLLQFISDQETDIRYDFQTNLNRAIIEIDEFIETKDMRHLGAVAIELREATGRVTNYRQNCLKDDWPVYSKLASVFSAVRTDISSYDESADSNIDLISLSEGLKYLLENKDVVYYGSTDEFRQLIDRLQLLIYNNS